MLSKLLMIIVILMILVLDSNAFVRNNGISTTFITKRSTNRLISTQLASIRGPVRYESDDWLQCLVTLPSSRILNKVKYYILAVSVWTTLLTILYKKVSIMLPIIKNIIIPPIPHSLASTVLGLLLVFRTNASYDRFSEGRKWWSQVVVAVRDISIASYIHIDKIHHKKLASLLMIFTICLKQHLQGEFVESEIEPWTSLIDDNDLQPRKLKKYKNIPIHLLRHMASMLTSLVIDKYQRVDVYEKIFGSSLHTLSSAIASCERLVKQPVPLSYTRHTSRFLSFYLFTLPLALLSHLSWATIPVMILLSWSFVSVQEIGLFIENPFSKDKQIIPLNLLISALREDIDETLDGIIGSDNQIIAKFDQDILQSMRDRSRMQSDDYFAYYQHDTDLKQ